MIKALTITILFFVLLFSTDSFAQSLKINGNITGFEDGAKVQLIDVEKSIELASDSLVENSFALHATVNEEPESYVLYITSSRGAGYAYIFCNNETLTVTGDAADMPNGLTVSGSLYNKPLSEINKLKEPFDRQKNQLQQKLREIYTAGKLTDSIKNAYLGPDGFLQKIEKEQIQAEKQYIATHLSDLYCIHLLNIYKSNHYTIEELKGLYKLMPADMQKTPYGKAIKSYYKKPILEQGDKFYDFKALSKDGNIRFSDSFTDNKYVLLVFGAPSCNNSMASMPLLENLHNERNDLLNVVMYYDGSNEEIFKQFSSAYPWEFLWNKDGSFNPAYQYYHIGATPTFFMFSPKGRLIKTWRGYVENKTEPDITEMLRQ